MSNPVKKTTDQFAWYIMSFKFKTFLRVIKRNQLTFRYKTGSVCKLVENRKKRVPEALDYVLTI